MLIYITIYLSIHLSTHTNTTISLCIYLSMYLSLYVSTGTPEYMSPTAINSKAAGPESDLWALGIYLSIDLFIYFSMGIR
jgi:serine/threonine protein kinase